MKCGSGNIEITTQNVWELGCFVSTSRTPHGSQHTADKVVVIIVSGIRVTTPHDGTKNQDHAEEAQSVQVLHHSRTLRQRLHRAPSNVSSLWGW